MDVLEAHAHSLARRLVSALEGEPSRARRAQPGPSFEAVLLEGVDAPPPFGALLAATPTGGSETRNEAQLRADLEAVLKQRNQLRAKLIAETERRERAEAELVAVGAQWLGTDTQRALQARAEAEVRRKIEAAAAAAERDCAQRVARVRAEQVLLRKRLGGDVTPSEPQLQAALRAALRAELESARREAHEQVRAQLEEGRERCLQLGERLAAAAADADVLRQALRKADVLLQEEWDCGFVAGLKRAAEALGHAPCETPQSRPPAQYGARSHAPAAVAEEEPADTTGPGGGGGLATEVGGASKHPSSVLQGLVIRTPLSLQTGCAGAMRDNPTLTETAERTATWRVPTDELSAAARARNAVEEDKDGDFSE